MNQVSRFLTTTVIWLAYTGIAVASLINASAMSAGEIWIVPVILLIVSVVAGFATHAVWRGAQQAPAVASKASSRKAKRDDWQKLARLVDELDQDEIVELETLLLARDEEQSL